jgi:hypothetical protein
MPTSRAEGTMPIIQAVQMINSLSDGLQLQSDLTLGALTHEGPGAHAGDNAAVPDESAALSYRRFDVALSAQSLQELGLTEWAGRIEELRVWDRVDHFDVLEEVGRRAALCDIDGTHLSPTFDIRPPVVRAEAA